MKQLSARTKSIIYLIIANIVVTWLLVKTPLWKIVQWISSGVEWLILQSVEGIQFVFGGLSDTGAFILSALMPIVFIASIIGLLVHFNIIPYIIKLLGGAFSKIFKTNHIVSVNTICNMFLGQNESLFMTKTALKHASDNTIFATLVGGMSSISVSVVGLYASYGASIEYIVISMIVTSFSSLLFCQIFAPTYQDEEVIIEPDKGVNAIDTMFKYGFEGFKSVASIAVALMIFISLIGLLNNILPLTQILSYIFYPIAIIMGIPANEAMSVATILATKLITNEAVAFSLTEFATLSPVIKNVMTVALCGFAGFGSIGILIGGYAVVAPSKTGVVARLGFKALMVATLANLFSAWLLRLVLI